MTGLKLVMADEFRVIDAVILCIALSALMLISIGWQEVREMRLVFEQRVGYLEQRGDRPSVTHFNFPEAKGTPYVNIDQKGYTATVQTEKVTEPPKKDGKK